MSFLRAARCHGSYGRGRKILKSKKNIQGKQAWDNTISDLSVHRATSEELMHRHEIHKSKNQVLAQWELREKALKKKWRNKRHGTPDPLEKRRLAIMKEVLFDQYQLKDVLERSDRAMAVVKDLFGDVPHRHPGFPNVTMAPYCDSESSQGPIVQKRDPPTQLSILSESVMDRQALNDVEKEDSFLSRLESSEDEHDISVNFQSNLNTDRVLHLLKEKDESALQLWADERLKTDGRTQVMIPPLTPCTPAASQLPDQTVKKKSSSYTPSYNKTDYSLSDTTFHLQSNQSSLDILNHLIKDVEYELEEYERQTGRQVTSLQKSSGLTGFSLTLVSSLSRLVRYVKEGELQLLQEMSKRQRLEVELSEHRALIDALTAEILSLKEVNAATQKKLQQYIVETDEHLSSFTRALELNRTLSATVSKTVRSSPSRLESAIFNVKSCRPSTFRNEDNEQHKASQENLPVKLCQWPSPSKESKKSIDLLAEVFQPAVLLSPPRQRSHQEFSSEALQRAIPSHPTSQEFYLLEKKQEEYQNTKNSPVSLNTRNSSEERQLFNHNWKTAFLEEDLENLSQASSFLSLPRSGLQQSKNATCSGGPKTLGDNAGKGDGQSSYAANENVLSEDLVARIAQLTKQNVAIRAQLNRSRAQSLEALEGEHVIKTQDGENEMFLNKSSGLNRKMQITSPPTVQARLEERIAELNRQSAEARIKLLQMIEQQKQTTTPSPPISPIPPQPEWTENGSKRIEVSIPQSEPVDLLRGDTASPPSKVSEKSFPRTAWGINKVCSPSNTSTAGARVTPVRQKDKVEKQREEGWFALSTHVK
ncbi:spindle and centriole-associated protein 1 isoform X2 [Microcaecilia unicolor]|uniref:Spindle and centriole-associated protein 1 n=1 Tax=Microcaecilia unicolor TaxID=1415580 RepID=A0A6P7XWF5_9AMPH|nr:spindle and centriole-associated protein 1 isoform X2 [Microcaecilia unicolor]